jgi:hypothetical protein
MSNTMFEESASGVRSKPSPLSFAVLSDVGSVTAKAFGIAFDLAEKLRPIYTRFGHALPDKNGDDSRVLPIPAACVSDRDRTVALAFVYFDNRNRFAPGSG